MRIESEINLNPVKIKSISDFNFATAASSGGKTGSMRVADINDEKRFFQYKESIVKKSWLDKKLANGMDNANLGEFLVSCVAGQLGSAPTIYLVPNPEEKTIDIVSAYLSCPQGGKLQSLDDFLGGAKPGSHTSLVSEITDESNQKYNLKGIEKRYPGFKKELAKAIALSALVGDHDINPGNMIVITDAQNRVKIVRIDYGHACENLCKHPKFGGKIVHDNPIIDYFNRTSLDHVPLIKKGEHKLWRDYPAIVSSVEMAQALTELAATDDFAMKIDKGLKEARETIDHLFLTNPQISPDLLVATYQKMAERVLKTSLSTDKVKSTSEKLDIIFDALRAYYISNQKHMHYAAQVLSLQVEIKTAVARGDDEHIDILRQRYQELVADCPVGNFSWFKQEKNARPFDGNFEKYLAEQREAKKFAEQFTSKVHHYFSSEDRSVLSQIDSTIKEKISQISAPYKRETNSKSVDGNEVNFREKFLFFLPQNKMTPEPLKKEVSVEAFLGQQGIDLYRQALAEELNSQEYLDKLTIALSNQKNKQIPFSLESLSKVRTVLLQAAQDQGYTTLTGMELVDLEAPKVIATKIEHLLQENYQLVSDNQQRFKEQFKKIVAVEANEAVSELASENSIRANL